MSYMRFVDYSSGDTDLPMAYPDFTISPGTKVVFDAKDPNCFAGDELPVGALASGLQLKNLLNDNAELALQAALPALGNTGLVFNAAGQRVTLPASVEMPATIKEFGFGVWVKPSAPAITTGHCAVAGLVTGGTDATTGWVIQQTYNATQAEFEKYRFRVCGTNAYVPGMVAGTVTFIFGHVVINQTALTCKVDAYKNGVLAESVTTALPAGGYPDLSAGTAVLGTPTAFSGLGWRGEIGRFVFQDFSAEGSKTISEFLADEMAQGAGPRFA